MMYALRALTVSLALFALTCATVLGIVRCGWPVLRRRSRNLAKPLLANLLLAAQLAPIVLASVTVLLFALPSFLRFEPHVSEEELSPAAAILALAAALWLVAAAARAFTSWRRTTTATSSWSCSGCAPDDRKILPCYHAETAGVLAVTGVTKQKLFVSRDILSSLTEEELDRAIAHEMVHVRRRDNLAKFAVLLCRVPGMQHIESAWLEAVEMTADERAVRSNVEALDLASALVKVSRLRTDDLPELALGFAATATAPLSARIERLLDWQEPTHDRNWRPVLCSASALLTVVVVSAIAYQPLLLRVHTFTEWLVR
jgi:beta-lactamase regulating signal transducer with metallopeptidase domain